MAVEVGLNLNTFFNFLFRKLLAWKVNITVNGVKMQRKKKKKAEEKKEEVHFK